MYSVEQLTTIATRIKHLVDSGDMPEAIRQLQIVEKDALTHAARLGGIQAIYDEIKSLNV